MIPSRRFRDAQAWWIASEICRRSPRFSIRTDIIDEDVAILQQNSVRIMFMESITTDKGEYQWDDVFAAEGPHEMVKRLEGTLGVEVEKAPATTPKTLVYRLIAHALNEEVNARTCLHATWPKAHTSGISSAYPFQTFAGSYEHLIKRLKAQPWEPLPDDPLDLCFVLSRDSRPVLLLDEGGWSHDMYGKRRNLFALYGKSHDVRQVYAEALAPLAGHG